MSLIRRIVCNPEMAPGGQPEAPAGGPYAGQGGAWVAIPPTGQPEAPAGGPYVGQGGAWIPIPDPVLPSHILVLDASTTSNQNPSGTNNPLQIHFGPMQGTGGDPVMLDNDGTVTINEAGYYRMKALCSVANGRGLLGFRALVNGLEQGPNQVIRVKDDDDYHPVHIDIEGDFLVNDQVKFEIVRDSGGDMARGRLEAVTFNAGGWGDAPSANIQVIKF